MEKNLRLLPTFFSTKKDENILFSEFALQYFQWTFGIDFRVVFFGKLITEGKLLFYGVFHKFGTVFVFSNFVQFFSILPRHSGQQTIYKNHKIWVFEFDFFA